LHKLSAYYARKYEVVVIKDLDVTEMLESLSNSHNTAAAAAAANIFIDLVEYSRKRKPRVFCRSIRKPQRETVRRVG
jgi:hypothetical protein